MKSKTSSSDCRLTDRTIFNKNIKRLWPLWAGYLFIMLWLITGITYAESSYCTQYGESAVSGILTAVSSSYTVAEVISVIMGLVTAMFSFGYLFNEKSCYFYHSLPVTREKLFFTQLISGLTIMFLPDLLVCILTMLTCRSQGYAAVKEMLLWLLVTAVCELFYFTFAMLCIMFTGQSVAAPLLYIIFLLYYTVMTFPVSWIFSNIYVGLDSAYFEMPAGPLGVICPFSFMAQMEFTYDNRYTGLSYGNIGLVLGTFAVCSVIFTIISLLLYRIRKSEHAGDTIVFRYARPVFRWGVGLSFGLLATALLLESMLYDISGTRTLRYLAILIFTVTTLIGYLAAEMIMYKSFRIFRKLGAELPIFTAVIALAFAVFALDLPGVETYVPDSSDVVSASLSVGTGEVEFTDQGDIEDVIAVHKAITGQLDNLTNDPYSDNGYTTIYIISIKYELKDGSKVSRNYYIPERLTSVNKLINDFIDPRSAEYILGDHDMSQIEWISIMIPVGDVDNIFYYLEVEDRTSIEKIYTAVLSDMNSGRLKASEALGSEGHTSMEYSQLYYSTDISLGSQTQQIIISDLDTYDYTGWPYTISISYSDTQYGYNYTFFDYSSECSEIYSLAEEIGSRIRLVK